MERYLHISYIFILFRINTKQIRNPNYHIEISNFKMLYHIYMTQTIISHCLYLSKMLIMMCFVMRNAIKGGKMLKKGTENE